MESGSVVCCNGCVWVRECVCMDEGCGYLSWKEGTGSQIITFLGGSGGENFPKGSRERQRNQALSVNELNRVRGVSGRGNKEGEKSRMCLTC